MLSSVGIIACTPQSVDNALDLLYSVPKAATELD